MTVSKDFRFADPQLDRHLEMLFQAANQGVSSDPDEQDYVEEISYTSGLVTSITFWDKAHKQIMKTYTLSYTSNKLTSVAEGIYSDGKLVQTNTYAVAYTSGLVTSITRTQGT